MEIEKQVKVFNKQASRYSKRARQNTDNHRMRKKLLQSAQGNILEVSVGAGANFQYYPKSSSVTAVDFSPSMVEKAKEVARVQRTNVTFHIGNVEDISIPAKSFDTVVSTLSLCSYPHPDKVLERLASWCKEDGQVLLFEHGISTNPVLAWLQNKLDSFFLKKNGCHQNRDIIKLVQASPLFIEKKESFMFNAVHLIWAKPKR